MLCRRSAALPSSSSTETSTCRWMCGELLARDSACDPPVAVLGMRCSSGSRPSPSFTIRSLLVLRTPLLVASAGLEPDKRCRFDLHVSRLIGNVVLASDGPDLVIFDFRAETKGLSHRLKCGN